MAAVAAAVPASAAPGPALTVDASADRAPIGADIYGSNIVGADHPAGADVGITVHRWGGNLFEGYNWRIGAVNTAADYFFENIADCFYWRGNADNCTNTPEYPLFVDRVRARGGRPLIQIPLAGYVARNAPTAHPFTCGFPVSTRGAQDSVDPFDTNCGNGVAGGTNLSSVPTETGVAFNPLDARDWVADLVSRFGRADAGGVPLYSLGNEPGLWPDTHRHIHPNPTTYDELRNQSVAFAGAVKDGDPSAKVLAFSEWAWPNYFCSRSDGAPNVACSPTVGANLTDRAAHSGRPLVNWLLAELKAAGDAQGRRLVDYIDVHYYQQTGATPGQTATTDITRSLWDPSYTDPSWINEVIRLVPRMREWVASDFPGLGTAISEYNLSIPGQPVDNVLIQADVLGIFGREGLDLATRHEVGADGTPAEIRRIYDAFQIYRNYDGAGGKFGDTRVRASSADQGSLAIYGAQRSGDGALTLVLVNKSASELTSSLAVAGFTASGPAKVYRWTGAAPGVQPAGETPLGGSVTVPAKSVTLLVAPGSTPANPNPDQQNPLPNAPGGNTTTKRCKVPRVVGKKLADARKLIARRGCKTGKVRRVKSKKLRKGRVVSQSRKANRLVKRGTKINLKVSRGRR